MRAQKPYWRSRLPWVAHDSSGQGLVEYVLIIALASIVVIVALALVGSTIRTEWYDSITSGLNFASGS